MGAECLWTVERDYQLQASRLAGHMGIIRNFLEVTMMSISMTDCMQKGVLYSSINHLKLYSFLIAEKGWERGPI